MMKPLREIQDELLVLRALESPEAMDALVRRWLPPLWTHAFRMLGERESAWDVSQEAWCTIVRKLHTLHEPAAFPKWAFRIVTNKARDWQRKHMRRRQAMAAYQEEVERPRLTPDAARDGVFLALERLSPDHAAVIELFYRQSFSIREISEILSVKEGTVKARLHRARSELRRHMEDLGHA